MKISARNKLHGTIIDVAKGATTAHVPHRSGRSGGHRVDHQRSGQTNLSSRRAESLRGHQGDRCDGQPRLTGDAARRRSFMVQLRVCRRLCALVGLLSGDSLSSPPHRA